MGRWAQAQRRGGGLPAIPVVRSPSGEDLFYEVTGADPPDYLRFTGVQRVPEGMNWYFWQATPSDNHADIVGEGDDNFLNFPRTTLLNIYPGGTFDMRVAWGRNGVQYSGWSDWLNLDF